MEEMEEKIIDAAEVVTAAMHKLLSWKVGTPWLIPHSPYKLCTFEELQETARAYGWEVVEKIDGQPIDQSTESPLIEAHHVTIIMRRPRRGSNSRSGYVDLWTHREHRFHVPLASPVAASHPAEVLTPYPRCESHSQSGDGDSRLRRERRFV